MFNKQTKEAMVTVDGEHNRMKHGVRPGAGR